jgi:DNA-binding MarR family transcriptional regulator
MTPEQEISYLLNQAVSAQRRHISRHLRDVGLSQLEWPVLRHTLLAEQEGRTTTLSALLHRTEMDEVTLRHVLRDLTDRGLVTVTADDERAIRLTDAGGRVAAPLVGVGESVVVRATSGLTAEDIGRLAEYLRVIVVNLSD